MSQVPVTLPPAPVMPNIPKGKAAWQAIHKNLDALILEEPEERSLDSSNEYDSDPKVQQSKDLTLDKRLEEEDLTKPQSM